uniref:NDUFA4 mitochondrial complex associated like 2 n=1 Tax=Amazona collaria TaxID=241587 RepID=A0A8B9FNR4_9PSIT
MGTARSRLRFAFPGARLGGRFITLNPSSLLIPLIGFISVGMGSAVLYLLRLALYSPDVSWDRKNNPEPWNKLSPTDQYKVSTGTPNPWGWALNLQ